MPDDLPKLSDDEVELLRRLSAPSQAGQSGFPEHGSFTDALKHPEPLVSLSTNALAQASLAKAAGQLSRMTSMDVALLRVKGKEDAIATDSCRALHPALRKIIETREAIRIQTMRQRRLEWLQLASCLDKAPLRVGAYQAHAERFLASAGRLMSEYFPWINFRIEVEENRVRSGKSHGKLRTRFNSGEYDFILVPSDAEAVDLETVYSYSFRVVGTEATLSRLKDSHGVIHIRHLRDENILVGPPNSSSRQRIRELMMGAGVDMEDGSIKLIEEKNPSFIRIRAESGQGLAIISDEYTVVGGSRRNFPHLTYGPEDSNHPIIYTVEMGLLRHLPAAMPRHQAFDFVVHELIRWESERERAAALE